MKAAFGITRTNPQIGKGGLPQVVIPDFESVAKQKSSIPLTNSVSEK